MIKRNLTAALLIVLPAFLVPATSWSKPTSNKKNDLGRYFVVCENPDDCHSAVAGILNDESNVCTGVLVREDIIATNLHCVPENMRKEGASCKGRISFTFPENKKESQEFADCDQVLSISSQLKDTPLTPDYAFLKLTKKASRKPVVINTTGVANNEALTIYKVDPHEDVGILKKTSCKAAQKSMLNPLFLTAQSSVISLVPCDIVSGNSGSPIFSASGEVKAIINSQGLPDDIPVNADRFSVAFASNFSCLNIPELGLSSKGSDCKDSMDRAAIRNASGVLVRDAVHPLMPNFAKNVGEQYKKLHEQTKNFLQWQTDQQDIPYTGDATMAIAKVAFKPKCISASRESLLKMQESLLKVNYSEWGVQLHLDSEGRPAPQLAATEVNSVLSFSKKDLMKSQVAIKVDKTQFTVPFCSEIASK
ncbi:trypsin-like serine peptidase [Bdellovibrio svalbardensis]|uniref:S1 family peptidase n=1 Tax=Bdellovibrio svalbardensis TaxID=2972972 RepID=A0ABT6DGG8_9BACT|nr:trypsin-like peptidase domain-containing protein [Bdellovibrio svalbardensis]MDG0815922.1 S1 family peptidase [Bdellovibrio svalbardensis]